MPQLTLDDVLGFLKTLKAQQNADATVIACLIAAVASGTPLADVWDQLLPVAIVEESLYVHENVHAGDGLEVFNERIAYWAGIIKSSGEGDE